MKLKFYFVTFLAVVFSNVFAQLNLDITNSISYTFRKKPVMEKYDVNNKQYFYIKYYENMFNTYDQFVVEDNKLRSLGKLEISNGTFNNSFEIISVKQLGNKLFAFIENRNKDEGKNKLIVRTIDENGQLKNDDKEIGSITYEKRGDPGVWHVYVTEDKKHFAVVMINPYIKGQPLSCKYYFMDENFKILSASDFNIGNEKKKSYQFKMLASNNGDIYLINEEYDKSYIFPVVYKKANDEKVFMEIPVMLTEPYKNYSYTSAIAPNGNLILAGYYQEKKGFIVGDVAVKGFWVFNSSKPIANTIPFQSNQKNLVARNISFLENTLFLAGEDVKKNEIPSRPGTISLEENVNYEFENIIVTGFDMVSETKYDLPIARKEASYNEIYYKTVSSGIYQNKFQLLYIDDEGKYDVKATPNSKTPVVVSINKDGLMEQPTSFYKSIKSAVQKYNDESYNFSYVSSGLSQIDKSGFFCCAHFMRNQFCIITIK